MQRVLMSFPMPSLLPNIRDLTWEADATVFPYLRFFVGPQLTTVILCFNGIVSELSVLLLLASHCPSLTDISIDGTDSDAVSFDVIATGVSSFILQLGHIRRLSVQSLNPATYSYLVGLPALNRLEITRLIATPFPHVRSDGPSFPALRELILTASRIDLVMNFVTSLQNSPLETVQIIVDGISTETQVQAFFSALGSTCCPASLQSVSVHFRDEMPRRPIGAGVLQPLLPFAHLNTVYLPRAGGGFALDDAFAATLTAAWPHLQRFMIPAGDPAVPPKTTIMALFSFARNCPRLTHLQLPFDATSFPDMPADHDSRAPRVIQTSLRLLHVFRSPIQSVPHVAGLISSIFPLASVVSRAGDPEKKKWDEVARLVPILAAVRYDERSLGTPSREAFSQIDFRRRC
ncbi:hypothetical protein C8R43DRAFT_1233825 [Mycena crocata]|nr:hypothetical protein C8R43DRAFT_1233825 [Mycena crocata]